MTKISIVTSRFAFFGLIFFTKMCSATFFSLQRICAHQAGQLDEVRLSKIVRYEKKFTPAPRHKSDQHTIALYNFDEGVIEFSGEATITEGGNQISSEFLVYNIVEQRINASSAGEGDH